MKKSEVVVVAVIGSIYLYTLFSHGDVYRDRYASREDCLADWGNTAADCREETNASGARTGRYWGPAYEDGARPTTRNPNAIADRTLVKRGGFGRSGARFVRIGG